MDLCLFSVLGCPNAFLQCLRWLFAVFFLLVFSFSHFWLLMGYRNTKLITLKDFLRERFFSKKSRCRSNGFRLFGLMGSPNGDMGSVAWSGRSRRRWESTSARSMDVAPSDRHMGSSSRSTGNRSSMHVSAAHGSMSSAGAWWMAARGRSPMSMNRRASAMASSNRNMSSSSAAAVHVTDAAGHEGKPIVIPRPCCCRRGNMPPSDPNVWSSIGRVSCRKEGEHPLIPGNSDLLRMVMRRGAAAIFKQKKKRGAAGKQGDNPAADRP